MASRFSRRPWPPITLDGQKTGGRRTNRVANCSLGATLLVKLVVRISFGCVAEKKSAKISIFGYPLLPPRVYRLITPPGASNRSDYSNC
ncbi:MAG TPA: hypothetical protein DDZ51_28425 [Planctomycetaceae bacterium]|nr:hypothetical protein [Planctomycetaceae bacterium]